MSHSLECHVYYDSGRHASPPAECNPVDVAAVPSAAEHLGELGVSAASDLPAVLLTEPGGKLRILGLRLSEDEVSRLAAGTGIPSTSVIVFSSSWCSDCRRAKRVLEEAETSFHEVDIDSDSKAEALVLTRSGGRRVVPTLRFDDRVWAFNPDPPLLRRLVRPEA